MNAGKKAHMQKKDATGALRTLNKRPRSRRITMKRYYHAGMAVLALGKPGDAEASFRKSIELSGDKYAEAEVGLGKVMLDHT